MFGDNMYPMPIFSSATNLIAADVSANNFTGEFPSEYFDLNSFIYLEYLSVSFNEGTTVPIICSKQAFCFKRVVLEGRNSNS